MDVCYLRYQCFVSALEICGGDIEKAIPLAERIFLFAINATVH